MKELPLFPLNTVLFPGMPLNLHIFEERYKLMVNQCIERREPFGVVLIENNAGDTNPFAIPHMVGCTAQITQVQPLREGRMKITAIGRERFQIVSLEHNRPYLVGMVELLPHLEGDIDLMRRDARTLRRLIDEYLTLLRSAGKIQFQSSQLPDNPLSLAYLSAVLLQTPNKEKQKLLAADSAVNLLKNLCTIYRKEVLLMEVLLAPPKDNDYRGTYSLS